jgi:hypothetical protein
MKWLNIIDEAVVTDDLSLHYYIVVVDHDLPMTKAVLHPLSRLSFGRAQDFNVHVMTGASMHSSVMTFSMDEDLNGFVTRLYWSLKHLDILEHWRYAVDCAACVNELLEPSLYFMPSSASSLLGLLSYLAGWPSGIMAVALPPIRWAGLCK